MRLFRRENHIQPSVVASSSLQLYFQVASIFFMVKNFQASLTATIVIFPVVLDSSSIKKKGLKSVNFIGSEESLKDNFHPARISFHSLR